MKKIMSAAMAVCVLSAGAAFAEEKTVTVKVDGITLDIADQQPIIEDNRTLVPMRAIFEALDAKVDWNEQERAVSASKDENTLEIKIGEKRYKINGEEKELDVPAQIKNNRTLVPLKVVADGLGCSAE